MIPPFVPKSNGRNMDFIPRVPPVNIYSFSPYENYAWMTSICPIFDGQAFLMGSASKHLPNLTMFWKDTQSVIPINNVATGQIWGLAASKNHIALIDDTCNMKILSFALENEGVRFGFVGKAGFAEKTDKWGTLRKITQVQFNPSASTLCATLDNTDIQLWDCVQPRRPSLLLHSDVGPNVFEWSPHDQNVMAVAEKSSSFRIIDTRAAASKTASKCEGPAKNMLWERPSAGKGTKRIEKLAWSPFIPYWLATADATAVNIYDLRYTGKNPVISMAHANVQAMAWSNSNCELLCTASSDRCFGMWSLLSSSQQSHCLYNASHSECGGEIVCLFPATDELNTFYGMTILGKLVKIDIEQEFLYKIAPRRFRDGPPANIELGLYCRDFGLVYESLVEFSNSAQPSDFSDLQELTNMTFPSVPISSEAWKYGKIDDSDRASFESDLNKYSSICPPKFSSKNINLNDEDMRIAIDQVRLKVKILEFLEKNDVANFQTYERSILSAIASNPRFLRKDILQRLIGLLIQKDRLRALKFAKSVILGSPSKLDNDGCIIMHMLLFPTLYDNAAASLIPMTLSSPISSPIMSPKRPPVSSNGFIRVSAKIASLQGPVEKVFGTAPAPAAIANSCHSERRFSNPTIIEPFRHGSSTYEAVLAASSSARLASSVHSSLYKILKSHKQSVDMMNLEIELLEMDTELGRLEHVNESMRDGRTSVSAGVVWRFLYGLFTTEALDHYFIHTSKLIVLLGQENAFANALRAHLENIAYPKLKFTFAQALECHNALIVVRSICMIVNMIVEMADVMPAYLEPFLLDRLKKLQKNAAFETFHRDSSVSAELKTILVELQGVLSLLPHNRLDGCSDLVREAIHVRSNLAARTMRSAARAPADAAYKGSTGGSAAVSTKDDFE